MVKVSLFKKNYCSCTKQVSWTSYILLVTCTYYFCCIIRRSRCLPFIFFFLFLNNLALALFRSVIRGSRYLPFLSNLEVRLLFKAFGLFFLKCSAVLCRALSWKVMLVSPFFCLQYVHVVNRGSISKPASDIPFSVLYIIFLLNDVIRIVVELP